MSQQSLERNSTFLYFFYRHKCVETLDNLMNFQTLNNDSSYSLINNKNSRQNRSAIRPDSDNSDKNNHLDTKDRTKLLKSIKRKIKSGYYNSNEVIDEISDAFAKVFDKTL